MFSGQQTPQYEYGIAEMKAVAAKSNDDLAESLEIMMVETRPIGDHRVNLRGAICILRDEPTNVTLENAVQIVQFLKGLWVKGNLPARVLICTRAIEVMEGKANAKQ